MMPRGILASALWPDRDDEVARHSLATALWRLKAATRGFRPLIHATGDDLMVDAGATWVDFLVFEARLAALVGRAPHRLDAPARHRMRAALALFQGEFLDGIDAEWADLTRGHLHCLYEDGLYALAMAEAAAGQWAGAILTGRRLCALEPLREDAHRLLMEAYLHTGNRALAVRQYRRCAEVLARELAVDPMPETQRLLGRLKTSRGTPTLASLAGVRDALRHSHDLIGQALTVVEPLAATYVSEV